jgi:hypothetical protein
VEVTGELDQRHRVTILVLVAVGLPILLSCALAACTVGRTTFPTVMDTGVSTTSTTPASVPALGSGITAGQIQELLARQAGSMEPEEWVVRDFQTFGDWAAAKVYSDRFINQDGQAGSGAVFLNKSGAWFYKDYVGLGNATEGAIALADMEAPEEVWEYFGLKPGAAADASYPPALPEQMPDDFGFVAEWGVARMNGLDTFEGTFTKDLVTGSPPTATTKLVLTSDEKQVLYQALRTLEPWSYPSRFEPPYADVTAPGVEQVATPAIKYHLYLAGARMEKDIWWADDNWSTTAGAVALRAWFRQVMDLVESRPEYKALPEARGGYA